MFYVCTGSVEGKRKKIFLPVFVKLCERCDVDSKVVGIFLSVWDSDLVSENPKIVRSGCLRIFQIIFRFSEKLTRGGIKTEKKLEISFSQMYFACNGKASLLIENGINITNSLRLYVHTCTTHAFRYILPRTQNTPYQFSRWATRPLLRYNIYYSLCERKKERTNSPFECRCSNSSCAV